MKKEYHDTTLWRHAFCGVGLTEVQTSARARLIQSMERLEDHVEQILKRIPEDCRGLTLHDISHSHQLWHVASTICGSQYGINPLEGFILGATFLIHDAGLTARVYPGGIKALRETLAFREMLSIELNRDLPSDSTSRRTIDLADENQESKVLFALLRQLHSDMALNLLNKAYLEPITKQSWTLVDLDLLLDVGELVGKIAASHHWSIGTLEREFREPATPPASFPGWEIDALKLACILRCADACAIDERRAPVMAFVLENPSGVSRDHWLFQRYLKPAHLRPSDDALIFESRRPFSREHMEAWWLAYEGIELADRELRDSDRVLRRNVAFGGREQHILFAARRVEGAANAAILKDYIKVDGWVPVETRVRISNPSALVELFGGKQLYGNDPTAPLRELIQNAADAIRARRADKGYGHQPTEVAGQIKVSIRSRGSGWVLRVIDDGIGMPEDVMIGELLDFGNSLWRSDRIAALYPGLISNPQFKPTGQFGIGFYASFILGKNVKVMSKRYESGPESRRILNFNGVRGRAELRNYDKDLDGDWDYGQSTIVEIIVDDVGWLSRFAGLSFRGSVERPIKETESTYWELFTLTVKKLVFCLDVPVVIRAPFADSICVNEVDVFSITKSAFADQFNSVFADNGDKGKGHAIPEELISLIDDIGNREDKSRGTVANDSFLYGIYHIGGLTVFDPDGRGPIGARSVTGVHQALPVTIARQSPRRSVQDTSLMNWAKKQKCLLEPSGQTGYQLGEALLNLYSLGVDLTDKYFLYDYSGAICYFSRMKMEPGDKLFLCCNRLHPSFNRIELTNQQNIFMFCEREYKRQSGDYSYVFEFYSGVHRDYGVVELFGNDFTRDRRTAVGQLFAEVERRGFEARRSELLTRPIGVYTGRDGGGNEWFFNPQIKNGMPIEATGIIVEITESKP